MSTDADRVVFDDSVSPQDNSVLFQQKRWTYITDSTSNGGVFNGQVQFDLNTLSSQNQWTHLREAIIQFPVKLTIRANSAVSSGAQAFTTYAATIKNGFHHFVDSVQITLGGSTIQSSQIFENVNTSYKILSEWSEEELRTYGATLGISMDDYQLSSDGALTAYAGLDNVALGTLAPNFLGVQYPMTSNPGYKERSQFLNTSVTAGAAKEVLGVNAAVVGKGSVQSLNGTKAVAVGEDVFCAFYLGTIRLRDISDAIDKLPLVKNMKGFIYVNYNASTFTYATDNAALPTAVPVAQSLYGRCMPAMLDLANAKPSAAVNLTFTAEISAVKSASLGGALPTYVNSRMYCPYYVASPEVDRALSMKKTLRFNERFVTTFQIGANGQFSGTLSPGIQNPQRVILLPYLTGTYSNAGGVPNFAVNPLLSPCDIVPAGSSPFAALKDLQLNVGGVPMWQGPITMDYESYVQEMAQQGYDGGMSKFSYHNMAWM